MTEKISIIVPVYNKEKYLPECLGSLVAQDYPDIEVILADDGSTDGSAAICEDFARSDARFSYLRQKNAGQNAARLAGVRQATGAWVMFVDADDTVTADCCRILAETAFATKADTVYGMLGISLREDSSPEEEGEVKVYSGEEAARNLVGNRFFSFVRPSGVLPSLYRKETIENVLTSVDKRITFSEDCACNIEAAFLSDRVAVLDRVVYHYRQVEDSYTHKHDKSNVKDQKNLLHYLRRVFETYGYGDDGKRTMEWLVVRDLLLGGYEFFADYPGIYPFAEDIEGAKVALYGAGTFGEEIYTKLGERFPIAGWFDKNFSFYQAIGKPVRDPTEISACDADIVLVAITHPDVAARAADDLRRKLGTAKRIFTISQEIIDSEYTARKLEELDRLA